MTNPIMKTKLKKPGVKTKDGLKVSGIYGVIITLIGSSLFPDIPPDTRIEIMNGVIKAIGLISSMGPSEILDWVLKITAGVMIGYGQLIDNDDNQNEQPANGE